MKLASEQPTRQGPQTEARIGALLIAAAILCLVAAGGLLWWRYGGAVFNDMVISAFAWCF
ncbi:hypothetical protein [Microvirga alba]|uniref:Uncharacterized protein n=1 Tax=Microvirga alba TaxID=2791025 RepID=A0A931FTX4_9HYPH|nr:hypothetical protein [Microvirga alba]MBF9235086.1 hypothetical protein [Microvirga alba]